MFFDHDMLFSLLCVQQIWLYNINVGYPTRMEAWQNKQSLCCQRSVCCRQAGPQIWPPDLKKITVSFWNVV